jgi:hypothetical protein
MTFLLFFARNGGNIHPHGAYLLPSSIHQRPGRSTMYAGRCTPIRSLTGGSSAYGQEFVGDLRGLFHTVPVVQATMEKTSPVCYESGRATRPPLVSIHSVPDALAAHSSSAPAAH